MTDPANQPPKPGDLPRNLDWSDDARADSVAQLHAYAVAQAESSIGWYWRHAKKDRWKGRLLRVLAILLTTCGGLVPLLIGAGIDWLGQQWGYVCLAAAGAALALDRFFGHSSAWIRYVTTATDLETGLMKFHMEWAQLRANLGGAQLTTESVTPLLNRLQALLAFVRATVEGETKTWASEYRSTISEIDKKVEAGLKEQRPGGIELTVDNAGDAEAGVRVLLDGVPMQTITNTTATLKPVFPGNHELRVEGTIGGKPHAGSKIVAVTAGAVVPVALTLKP
ncbi:MAG: SLATT domain-containing protein [bacterium]|nr:SLATT domain-containing protein [bacterium]